MVRERFDRFAGRVRVRIYFVQSVEQLAHDLFPLPVRWAQARRACSWL
jgi:hypothetical protein